LVKVKDSADLARGLIQVINQGRNDDERSSRQNQILKRHSVEDMVGAYEKLYLSGG
jgi:hypothetical protein